MHASKQVNITCFKDPPAVHTVLFVVSSSDRANISAERTRGKNIAKKYYEKAGTMKADQLDSKQL
jgi:hypothetical protein